MVLGDIDHKLKTAVIGASGYAGIEACRLLLGHPGFELVIAASDSMAGRKLSDAYPAFTGSTELAFSQVDHDAISQMVDVVFLAVPHTAAMSCAQTYLDKGVAVVDLSADFRLHDQSVFEKWYKVDHSAPQLLGRAVYGQPETRRPELESAANGWDKDDFSTTPLVACAGCYCTATILASAPVFLSGLTDSNVVIANAMSGVSGAGKKATERTHFCHAHESVEAYSAGNHRHAPEIAQELSIAAGHAVNVVFTPHLVPMKRGLLSTVNISLLDGVGIDDVKAVYEKAYGNEHFVHFLEDTMPQTASVVGSNHAQVGVAVDSETGMLIASCAIDNLDKGAASQAVQCANIICGYDEWCGLDFVNPVV